MDDKVESLFKRLEGAFEKWLSELEAHPVRQGVKTLLVLYVLRWIKRELF